MKKAQQQSPQKNMDEFPDIRTGFGYDVHRLISGSGMKLCGTDIPCDFALSGHSDADVALHALTDAVLAAICAGDIGTHFPPTDPQWKGADSRIFLDRALQLLAEAGGQINHIDVTLVCEVPKIAPHRDNMRESLAKITGMPETRISVKATTTEKLGFTGRREGIAAYAVATAVIRNAS